MIERGSLARRLLGWTAGLLCVAGSAAAQTDRPPSLPAATDLPAAAGAMAAAEPRQPSDFGTAHVSYFQVAGAAFTPLASGAAYATLGNGYGNPTLRTTTGSFTYFAAPLNLPGGARLKSLQLDNCDNTGATGYVQGTLVVSDSFGANIDYADFLVSKGTGCTSSVGDLTAKNFVVDNQHRHYWLVANVSYAAGYETGLAGMVVGYQLQVSAAPATATFGDVPASYLYFRAIEAFAGSGITGGCGSGNYCPNQSVTRGELAKFFANALGL